MPQKDFYALSAFFNNSIQRVKDDNSHDTPAILVPPKEREQRWFDLQKEIESKRTQINQLSKKS